MTDEPHIGQAQNDLNRAVRHERQGKREHRPLVNVHVSSRVDSLRRKTSSDIDWIDARTHGRNLRPTRLLSKGAWRRR
jgi:hypothetical protein